MLYKQPFQKLQYASNCSLQYGKFFGSNMNYLNGKGQGKIVQLKPKQPDFR